MSIAILILNWNGKSLLERFLPSVVEHSVGHPIYIVDNASTDDSINWVKLNFPGITVISIPENKGYAGGYNYVIGNVEEEIICLLNNDVQTTHGWCDSVLKFFNSDKKVAAVQPKILDVNNPTHFEYAGASGGFLDSLAYPYCRGRIFNTVEEDQGQYDSVSYLDWASGAALFLRKQAFIEVGGFDESYFAHQEEIDLCWRFQLRGLKIACIPQSVVYHLGGGTLAASHPQKTYLNFRNSLYNIVKNDYRPYWVFILFLRMILDGVAGIRYAVNGDWAHLGMIFKAHRSLYLNLNQLIKKRTINKDCYTALPEKRITSIVWRYFVTRSSKYSQL